MPGLTLYDKIWNEHLVSTDSEGRSLLYIDRHLVHEVTSPQAFDGLRIAKRDLWRRDSILATADHNVPTARLEDGIQDPLARNQVETLAHNCEEHGIQLFGLGHRNQGIVHIIGPELGFTLPGITLVCGDSHTSTHGALGSLAFGAGTSEVEHVMATQCLSMSRLQNMRVDFCGQLPPGLTSKDMVLALIGHIGTAGGTGAVIEYAGEAVRALSIEGRMTICNMTVEGGAPCRTRGGRRQDARICLLAPAGLPAAPCWKRRLITGAASTATGRRNSTARSSSMSPGSNPR